MKKTFNVVGMHCASCEVLLKDILTEEGAKKVDVSWKMIIGLRNIIAHDYFALDVISIWHIVSVNIPDLESKLHNYLAAHNTKYLPPFDDETPLLG